MTHPIGRSAGADMRCPGKRAGGLPAATRGPCRARPCRAAPSAPVPPVPRRASSRLLAWCSRPAQCLRPALPTSDLSSSPGRRPARHTARRGRRAAAQARCRSSAATNGRAPKALQTTTCSRPVDQDGDRPTQSAAARLASRQLGTRCRPHHGGRIRSLGAGLRRGGAGLRWRGGAPETLCAEAFRLCRGCASRAVRPVARRPRRCCLAPLRSRCFAAQLGGNTSTFEAAIHFNKDHKAVKPSERACAPCSISQLILDPPPPIVPGRSLRRKYNPSSLQTLYGSQARGVLDCISTDIPAQYRCC